MKDKKTNSIIPEKHISSQLIYDGKVISYRIDEVSLPNGQQAKREIASHNGGVVIVPCILTSKGQWEYVLVEQFRYATGQSLLEFPAGKLSLGEDPHSCALRELSEETGYQTSSLTKLGEIFPSPGFCSECLHLYITYDMTAGIPHPDEDEYVIIHHISHAEMLSMIKAGKIKDAKTLSAWTLSQMHLEQMYNKSQE